MFMAIGVEVRKTEANMLLPEECQKWLEWSGMVLLSMNIRSPAPKSPSATWPSFAQDAKTAYGYTNEKLKPATPTANQIMLMDAIFELPDLIDEIRIRRIVQCRSLVTPVSQRYLHSYSKLAKVFHTSKQRVFVLHHKGLSEICDWISYEKIYTIRQSFHTHSNL